MKLKKILSIICVMVLLCNLFAIIPTNAFTSITSPSDVWTASDNSIADWRFDPTVDGYDDYVHIDSRFAIRTNIAYDFNTTKLLINNLEIPTGYNATLMITPDAKCQNSIVPDSSKGEICLILKYSSTGELIVNRKESSYEYAVGVYEPADTYEFEFIAKTNVKYVNHSPKYTYEYMFGVNNEFVSTTDSTSWIYKFGSSSTYSKGYISIGTYNYVKANLKLATKETFIPTSTNGLCYAAESDSDGYQSICSEESTYTLSTSTSHNLFEEALVIKDVSWNDSLDAAMLINFSYLHRVGEASLLSRDSNLGLRILRDGNGSYIVYVNKRITNQKEELIRFRIANPLKISFVSDGAGGYGISFNGYYCENSFVTTFLKAIDDKECYVSISAKYSFECDAKFEEIENPVWISDNAFVKSAVNEDGVTVYSPSGQTSLSTAKKYNVLDTTIIMENAYFGKDQRMFMLGFSTTHIGTDRVDDGANGKLIFDIYTQNDSNGNCTGWRVHTGYSTQISYNVAPADSYYISLCEIEGIYYLKINERLYTTDSIQAFCENYAESAYISISAYNSTMNFSLDVWDKGPGYELTSDFYSISNDVVGSVEAYTSSEIILDKIDVTDGYLLGVTDLNGVEKSFADLLATGDRLTVSYKGREVGSYEFAVAQDINLPTFQVLLLT